MSLSNVLKKVVFYLRRDALLYVVFFTGAVVLAVEIMAVRILSPYFGNTIFSFSSVISVILAALSLGYWRGGRMADDKPDAAVFYSLISRAGWSVLVVQIASTLILPLVAMSFSIMTGPLVASMILFFYPSYVFGLLSPFVIKLRSAALPERGIGAVSGEVFFASTVGSIVGSLLSGFVLIPQVGISTSMISMAVLTILIGIIGRYLLKPFSKINSIFLAVLLLLSVIGAQQVIASNKAQTTYGTTLFSEDGVYEHITVIDMDSYNNMRGRVLVLDRTFSSGVTLPYGDLLFKYTPYYWLHSLFLQDVRQALVLGAGTGTIAKELFEDHPEAHIDIVDIEPRLFDLAHEYFFLPKTPQITTHTADGRQFLRTNDTKYDFIFADMYSGFHSIPWQVSTREYYELLYSSLHDDGVYIGNYIAATDYTAPSLFGSMLHTLRDVFGEVSVFAVESPESTDVQNFIFVATKNAKPQPITREDLLASEDVHLRQFADHVLTYDPAALQEHLIFTDELAPVDLYSAHLFSKM